MSKRRYKLEDGMDLSLMLEIDTSIMTPELSMEVNEFRAGAPDILEASDCDVIQAILPSLNTHDVVFLPQDDARAQRVRDLFHEAGLVDLAALLHRLASGSYRQSAALPRLTASR